MEESSGWSDVVSTALVAMLQALLALLCLLLVLAFRALQAVFVLARPATSAMSVLAMGAGAVLLFQSIFLAYGGDWAAAVLALALVCIVPAALLILASRQVGLWAAALASGGLMLVARAAIDHAGPMVRAAIPCVGLAACVLYFTFERKVNDE